MPQAWPIFYRRYVQFLPPDSQAPRVEREAWTQEVKGHHRYGTGVLYRLPGPFPIGVMLGRWTDRPLALRQQIAAERSRRDHGLRLIRPDEEGAVFDGVAEGGWHPPFWHWRRYVGLAYRLDLIYVDGFGNLRWKRPRWSIRRIEHTPLTDAFVAGDVEGIDSALPKRTVATDPGWDDEVRAVAIEMKAQREAQDG